MFLASITSFGIFVVPQFSAVVVGRRGIISLCEPTRYRFIYARRYNSCEMFRRRRHRPDSTWSWFACVCASIYQASSLGFSLSFGIMLPELMKQFDESRQKTGEWISRKFVLYFGRSLPQVRQVRGPRYPQKIR